MPSKKLLKPIWQHQDPEHRLKALGAFAETDPKHQEIIVKIALTDTEPLVQQAAINRLLDCRLLEDLLPQEAQASAAQERLMYLIRSSEDTHQDIITAYLEQARADVLTMIACQSPHSTSRSRALARITDQQRLFAVAAESTFAHTREAAASRVESPELLKQLWEKARKRDKNLARKLQERLDKPRQDERHSQQIEARAEKIITAMEEHGFSVWTPDYKFHFLGLESQWEVLGSEVNQTQTERYREANKKVAAIVAEQNRVLKTQEQQAQLLADAGALQQEALLATDLAPKIQDWQSLRQCWLDSLAVTRPERAMKKAFAQFETTFATLERLAQIPRPTDTTAPGQQIDQMEAAIAELNWSSAMPQPAALGAVMADLQHYKDVLRDQVAGEKAQVESISKQITLFRSAVRRKDLRSARGVRKKVLARMEQSTLGKSPRLIDQLEKADQELRELVDWKEFAIQPKFLELCEQMEALVEAPQSPRQQADSIKTLQQTWKALNALAPDEMWQRFQQAGAKAFEPCVAFYAEQNRQRAANLERRKVIVTQLEALANLPEQPDWAENPDWKDFRTQLHKLHNNWHKHVNVNQLEARETGKRYAALRRQLEAHLQAEYAINLVHKQRLLDRANTLASTEVTSRTLDEIKALQTQWKEIGVTDRKDDQKMWRIFRDACDRIFGTHQQQIDAGRADAKNQMTAAKKIIQSIKALAKVNTGVAPDEAKMQQLESEFKELPELPDDKQKKLNREVRKALALVHAATHKFKAAESARRLVEMRRRAEICATIEWARDKSSATVKALQTDWDLELLPAELLRQMEARRDAALKKNFSAHDFQQAERERRLICIELETLFNQDSPAEDKALRMEYQLQLLQSRGLHANQDAKSTAHQLHCRWYQIPAANKQTQIRLDDRFHGLQTAIFANRKGA